MSVILDALKKAQDERKRPAYRDGGGDEGPPNRPRWIFYVIVGAAVCAIILVLFLPNLYKMQTPSTPQVAQQRDVPPPPPAPPKAAPEVPPAKPEEFPKFVMQPPKSDATELPKLDKRPRQRAAGPDMRTEKKKPDGEGEPQKSGPKAQKAEEPVAPVVPSPDSTVIVKKMTSERITTNYNNALRTAEEGRTEEARKLYMAVLADQPDNVEALNNLGVLAMRENNPKEALFHFRRILEYRKDYAKAYNNLGIIMLRERENRIAEEYFRKAIEVAPEGIEPYLNLVALMRSEKRLDEANRMLDALLRKGQRGGQVFLSAALIKDEMGQYEDAVKYYRYYLHTSPQNQERRRVVERLSFLEESQSAAGR
jgi:tetratricopeptide (TPR) repeat protein